MTGPRRSRPRPALQQALAQVGIKTTLHGYPAGTYYANFGGVPKYVHQHDLGICFGGWAPDWPDGYGFFDFIGDGNTIGAAGNTNIEELNDPVVNSDLAKIASTTNDATIRNSYTSQIDMQIMKDAASCRRCTPSRCSTAARTSPTCTCSRTTACTTTRCSA